MADFTGMIVNFTQAHIDNDGVPYFEFALQLPPPPNPPDPPIEKILYINLRKHHAPSAVVAVTSAWANQIMVDVFLEPQSQGKMRVLGVVPAR